MAFKILEAVEQAVGSVNTPQLVGLVRAGAKFEKGVIVERPKQQDQEAAAGSAGESDPQVLIISRFSIPG